MVQFGVYLESFRNPSWADSYIDYEGLKAALYKLQAAVSKKSDNNNNDHDHNLKQSDVEEGKIFENLLADNLVKINQFYLDKSSNLKLKLDLLKEKTEETEKLSLSEKESLKQEFHSLYVEINLLRDYSNLNYTGFSKILKKHDKIIPQYKMKATYFKKHINNIPVFGVLEALFTLQAETQSIYSEVFEGFNRLDTEISFGEALAKATGDIARATNLENRKRMIKSGVFQPSYGLDTAEDLLLGQHLVKNKAKKEKGVMRNALFQRARNTIMAANSLNSQNDSVNKSIFLALFLVMAGGCGQSLCLEYMVKIDPGCGATITFFQYLFIAAQGMKDFSYFKPVLDSEGNALPFRSPFHKLLRLRLTERKIPLIYHAGCVLMSWLSAVLSTEAYRYGISVPFHMVFKSSILLVNMCIGFLIMKKSYTLRQFLSVLMLSFGVMISTLASLPKQNYDSKGEVDFVVWTTGLIILAISLIFTGFLGTLQDISYKKYGQHWQEAMFYAHFLGLPLFLSLSKDIYTHSTNWFYDSPMMWLFLVLNTITTFLGVNGVYKLIGLTGSLTANLTITVRKFISLIVSVVYFKNDFTLHHWLGSVLVLAGTTWYTQASQPAPAKPKKE